MQVKDPGKYQWENGTCKYLLDIPDADLNTFPFDTTFSDIWGECNKNYRTNNYRSKST